MGKHPSRCRCERCRAGIVTASPEQRVRDERLQTVYGSVLEELGREAEVDERLGMGWAVSGTSR